MPARCPLHIVTGKGGVGKTTVALALAHALAADGATVVIAEVEGRGGLSLATGVEVGAEPALLFEVGLDERDQRHPGRDPRDDRHDQQTLDRRLLNLLFGRPPRRRAGRVEGVQIDARASLGGYLQRHYRLGFAADVLQVEPLVDFATRIAPGLRDILLIGQVTHLTETHPEIDALVLDAPPSGRIGSFLGAGAALAELTDGSPIAAQAASVMDDLRDPGCRTHVVTLLDELPVSEAIETVLAIKDLGLGLGSLIANRCLTPVDLPEPPPAPTGICETDWALITDSVVAENERARAQTAWQALLEHRTGLPLVRLPELPAGPPAAVQPAELAHLLGARVTALDFDALLRRDELRLLLCVGTGGVGKTTLSAALALRAAALGRRVVVVTIDPAKRLAQAMGLDGLAHEPTPVPIPAYPTRTGSLDAMMLDVRDAFDRALTAQVDAAEAVRIRANPFYKALAEAFSGTQEYVAMEKIGELHRRAAASGEWDLIVVDTPPSASALDFLDGPNRLEALARNPLLRVVLGLPKGPLGFLDAGAALATKALDAILGGRLFGDLRTFLRVFERAVLAFESHAADTRRLLASDAAGFVVVAAPRPTPAREASALIERLRLDALPVRGVVVNQVASVPVPIEEETLRAAAASGTADQRMFIERYREQLARAASEQPLIAALGGSGVPWTTIGRRPEPVSDLTSLVALLGGFDQQPAPGADV